MSNKPLFCSHGVPFSECPDKDAHHAVTWLDRLGSNVPDVPWRDTGGEEIEMIEGRDVSSEPLAASDPDDGLDWRDEVPRPGDVDRLMNDDDWPAIESQWDEREPPL